MTASLGITFERSELSDVTRLKAWTSSSEVLPSEVFLYEYDNVSSDYLYSRVCRYADIVNWRTARQDVNDRFIRRGYTYLEAYNDATVNRLESGIRYQVNTLIQDVSGCTDTAADDLWYSGDGYMFSGTTRSGIESVRVDMSLWKDGSAWDCLVMCNEYAGSVNERSGSLLSVATVRDMEDISTSGSGSGTLWRSHEGTTILPSARVPEFLAYISGDLYDLNGIPAWDGSVENESSSPAGEVYI